MNYLDKGRIMKRAIIIDNRSIKIENVPEPIPNTNQVKIKIAYCGICGSDIEEFTNYEGFTNCFGHEISGIVIETGEDVTKFEVGDKVAVHSYEALGFSEFTVESEDRCVKLAENTVLKEAALLEPLAVVLCGIRYCDFNIGDTVYVSGCGTIGLLAIQLLQSFGARKIIATDPSEFHRDKAKEFGADYVFDPKVKSIDEIIALVEKEVDGKVDFSMECAGVDDSMLACNKVLKPGKTLCALGLSPDLMKLSALQLFTRPGTWEPGVKIQGMTPFDINMFEVGARLIAEKKIDPLQIVSGTFALDDIQEAFNFSIDRTVDQVKNLIKM